MHPRFFRKPITPDLSPNLRVRDAWFGLGQLLLPWNWPQWVHGKGEELLSQAFRQQFGTPHAFTFDSGRVALHAVVRAMQLQPGDEVVVQSFTCVVVPDAVIAAGATPIYIDIDNTYNIDVQALKRLLEKPNRIKAVIVQHTFGVPAEIEEIVTLCASRNVRVIEDCAHSLGATVGGKLVGTFGDAAIFSFGRDKVLSTVSGGVAVSTHNDIANGIQTYESSLPYPSHHWIAQRLAYPAVFELAKWLYHVGPIGKMIIEISKRLGIVPLVIKPAEKQGKFPVAHRMPSVLAKWASLQMDTLDATNAHRRMLASIYMSGFDRLIKTGIMKAHQTLQNTEPMWLRWSVEVPQADALRAHCKQRGVLLGSWYDTPVAPQDTNLASVQYTRGACPAAEQIADHVVNLPTNINTSAEDAQHIVEVITQFYTQL